ncbi:MAG: hypothetical protein ACAI34_09285 [Verrucomicrobium sp.]
MPTPFTGSIIGSWLFVRSTKPDLKASAIYHFTADGTNIWETEYEGRSMLTSLKYECTDDALTFIYPKGPGKPLRMVQEDDGTVRIPNSAGDHIWWMIKLTEPKPYSIAFVEADGVLQRINPLSPREL